MSMNIRGYRVGGVGQLRLLPDKIITEQYIRRNPLLQRSQKIGGHHSAGRRLGRLVLGAAHVVDIKQRAGPDVFSALQQSDQCISLWQRWPQFLGNPAWGKQRMRHTPFGPAKKDIVIEGVNAGIADIMVGVQIELAGKQWIRISVLVNAVIQIMVKRIYLRICDICIDRNIPIFIQQIIGYNDIAHMLFFVICQHNHPCIQLPRGEVGNCRICQNRQAVGPLRHGPLPQGAGLARRLASRPAIG